MPRPVGCVGQLGLLESALIDVLGHSSQCSCMLGNYRACALLLAYHNGIDVHPATEVYRTQALHHM